VSWQFAHTMQPSTEQAGKDGTARKDIKENSNSVLKSILEQLIQSTIHVA
jgi:hypothetical protein